MLDGGDGGAFAGDLGGEPGVRDLVVPRRDGAPLADEGNAVFAAGEELQGYLPAAVQPDAADLEYPVDGCLAFYHAAFMAQKSWCVKNTRLTG